MLLYYALPLTLGVMVVLQGGLNRQFANSWGLGTALVVNATVLFLLSALFYGILRLQPDLFPSFLRPRTDAEGPAWWHLFPGICGFCLVLCLPWSIQNIGAAKSFILLITAQIFAGLLWDFYLSGNSPGLWKVVGAGFTLLGSLLVIFG